MYQTEKEILARQGEQLFGIQKIISNANVSLDDVAELVPGLVHLNRMHTLDLVYLDKRSREKLELEKEDLLKNGRQILMEIVKPESFQQAKRLFGKMDIQDFSLLIVSPICFTIITYKPAIKASPN